MQVSLSDIKSYLVIALFLIQVSYLNYLMQLWERRKAFLLPATQNNPHAKVARFGVACSAPPQMYELGMD